MLWLLPAVLGAALEARGQRPPEDDSMAFIQTAQLAMGRRQASEDPEAVFRQFDADASGSMSMKELLAFLKSEWMPDVTPAQARKIMRKSDADTDFNLDMNEFIGCAADPVACNAELPESVIATRAAKEMARDGRAGKSSSGPSSSSSGSSAQSSLDLDLSVSDFLPDEWTMALKKQKQTQVERCTSFDRGILKKHGLHLQSKDPAEDGQSTPASLDPQREQMLQIRGSWVKTILMPDTCKDALKHAGRIDRPRHAQCMQDALNLTIPCARCNTNFLYNMVHNCASACTPSMNSPTCVECTKPLKLLECVEGKTRLGELQLSAEEIVGEKEAEGIEGKVVGGDTPTGELIIEAKPPEEEVIVEDLGYRERPAAEETAAEEPAAAELAAEEPAAAELDAEEPAAEESADDDEAALQKEEEEAAAEEAGHLAREAEPEASGTEVEEDF
mmetsp:Transcript_91661/g.268271  ORF Transcript_91661/g.268271 Transcript_91661/m.268271 type:complete len:446 (+) Transcript_91661:78-1415(+)